MRIAVPSQNSRYRDFICYIFQLKLNKIPPQKTGKKELPAGQVLKIQFAASLTQISQIFNLSCTILWKHPEIF